MNRGRRIGIVVVGLLFGGVLFLVLRDRIARQPRVERDAPTGTVIEVPRFEAPHAGEPHLVRAKVSSETGPVARVAAVYRAGAKGGRGHAELERVGESAFWAGVIPGRGIGETVSVWFVVEVGQAVGAGGPAWPREEGTFARFPAGAPEHGRLFEIRWEGETSGVWEALSAVGAWGGAVLFFHATFFVLLFFAGRPERKGEARAVLRSAYLALVAGAAFFFLGAVPLRMLSHHARFRTVFEGWPAGEGFRDARSVIVLLLWVALLAWRWDLFGKRGDPRPISDGVFPALVLVLFALTAGVFLLPPPFFPGL